MNLVHFNISCLILHSFIHSLYCIESRDVASGSAARADVPGPRGEGPLRESGLWFCADIYYICIVLSKDFNIYNERRRERV